MQTHSYTHANTYIFKSHSINKVNECPNQEKRKQQIQPPQHVK